MALKILGILTLLLGMPMFIVGIFVFLGPRASFWIDIAIAELGAALLILGIVYIGVGHKNRRR